MSNLVDGKYKKIVKNSDEQTFDGYNIQVEKDANIAHYTVGKNIREVIAKNGGTMPEDLPTPEKSLKQLEKENKSSETSSYSLKILTFRRLWSII